MNAITSIRVQYKHIDGWHVFSSEKIAGLYVASKNAALAYNDVGIAIGKLLKLNEGITCKVKPEMSFPDFMKKIETEMKQIIVLIGLLSVVVSIAWVLLLEALLGRH